MQTVSDQKQTARHNIINRTINPDQNAIIARWSDTFTHVGSSEAPEKKRNSRAIQIIQVAMAAVAQGEFEISISGNTGDGFIKPSHALCVADYLSHASRVMIDYKDLSKHNMSEFLKNFPRDELSPRPSTHSTTRSAKDGILTEEKSKKHGVKGALLNVIDTVGTATKIGPVAASIGIQGPALTDFGIDIQMGGVDQPNLSGGIRERGYDGHVLIHLNTETNSVMIGLEQTRPYNNNDLTNLMSGFFNSKSSPPNLKHEDDNTRGLSGSHSLLGNSDEYTAAGSLYFSNLIYKIKLLEDKGELTPTKYNGMRVHLNDENYPSFAQYLKELLSASTDRDDARIIQLLRRLPRTAIAVTDHSMSIENKYLFLVKNISDVDLTAYFKQLKDVYGTDIIDNDQPLIAKKLKNIQDWLGVPRRLTQPDTGINVFVDGELSSTNPQVKQLARTLNRAVEILTHQATNELRLIVESPPQVFKQIRLLEQAYSQIQPDPAGIIYKNVIKLCSELNAPINRTDPALAFGYLIKLQEMQDNIALVVSTNESRALINLQARAAVEHVHHIADHHAQHNAGSIWDWTFVWQCMSSPAAINTYGIVLMIAGLIIAGAVAVGTMPVVFGATLAVSQLSLSAACFF